MRSLLLLAAAAAASLAAHAQWQRVDAPVDPGPIATTAAPGGIVIGSPKATRGNLLAGAWSEGIAELGEIRQLLASPDAPNVLYATTAPQPQTLWRTVDAGATWHELKAPPAGLQSVAAGPFASGLLYGWDSGSRPYRSRNAGFSWAPLAGAADPASVCAAPGQPVSIGVHPETPGVVLAAVACGIARSEDFGDHWELVHPVAASGFIFGPRGSGHVYTAGPALRSRDGGRSWSAFSRPDASFLQADPYAVGTLWARQDAWQVLKSVDDGDTWAPALASLPNLAYLRFPAPGEVLAVSNVDDPFRWTGQGWAPLEMPGGAPAPLQSFAVRGDGAAVATGPAMLLVHYFSVPAYRKLPGGAWRNHGSTLGGYSLAADLATGTLYGFRVVNHLGHPTGSMVRFDADLEPVALGGLDDFCTLLAARTLSGVSRVLVGCFDKVYALGLPLSGRLPSPTITLAGTDSAISAHWSSQGVITVLAGRQAARVLYRAGRVVASWQTGQGPRSIAGTPDGKTLFAGFPDGIRASSDGGLHWQPFDRGARIEDALLSASREGLYASNSRGMFFCPAFDCAGAEPLPRVEMEELHYPATDRYFLSMNPAEVQQLLASGGWVATGRTIGGFAIEVPGTEEIVRFFGTPGIGPDSHFYATRGSFELAGVHADPGWIEERSGSLYVYPAAASGCTAGAPVYRLYNGLPAASNHRYTSDRATYDAMLARGWLGEGVRFCAP